MGFTSLFVTCGNIATGGILKSQLCALLYWYLSSIFPRVKYYYMLGGTAQPPYLNSSKLWYKHIYWDFHVTHNYAITKDLRKKHCIIIENNGWSTPGPDWGNTQVFRLSSDKLSLSPVVLFLSFSMFSGTNEDKAATSQRQVLHHMTSAWAAILFSALLIIGCVISGCRHTPQELSPF